MHGESRAEIISPTWSAKSQSIGFRPKRLGCDEPRECIALLRSDAVKRSQLNYLGNRWRSGSFQPLESFLEGLRVAIDQEFIEVWASGREFRRSFCHGVISDVQSIDSSIAVREVPE